MYRGVILHIIILSFVFIALQSCGGCIEKSSVDILSFDRDVVGYASMTESERKVFKDRFAVVLDVVFDSVRSDDAIMKIPRNPIFRMSAPDVQRRFGDYASLSAELSELSAGFKSVHPNADFKFFTTITPYYQSVMFDGTNIIIGVNHYLGKDNALYKVFDEYKRRRKEPSRIVPDLSEVVARDWLGALRSNPTLLDAMVYEGCVAHLETMFINGSDVFDILGYDAEERQWCDENAVDAWRSVIANDYLYSSSQYVISDFILPAPFTSLVSQSSPGGLGRYIGYYIVEKYINVLNLERCLNIFRQIICSNSEDVLIKSGYNGKSS
ncbi:MAG: hypothetical protein ACI4A8_03150 [Muribaculaceae bacterium]